MEKREREREREGPIVGTSTIKNMGCAPSQPTVERQRKSEMGVVEVALIFGLMEQQVKTSQRGGSGS